MKKHAPSLLLAAAAGFVFFLTSTSARAQTDFPLYVANGTGETISQITSAGVVSLFANGTGVRNPKGLAFDAAGNLYVGNAGNNTIEKFSSVGVDLGAFANTGLSNHVGLAFDASAVSLFDQASGRALRTARYDQPHGVRHG